MLIFLVSRRLWGNFGRILGFCWLNYGDCRLHTMDCGSPLMNGVNKKMERISNENNV